MSQFEPDTADATLSGRIAEFARFLRNERGFRIGVGEVRDALRALDVLGVTHAARFRTALRTVLCSSRDEIEIFERAFDAFFVEPASDDSGTVQRDSGLQIEEGEDARPPVRLGPQVDSANASGWEALIARYSPVAGSAMPPAIPRDGTGENLRAASALIAILAVGRSRRRRPQERGERFDLRRTLRSSLQTGGDPVRLRRLGRPRRNPRFILLIDGSRSMTGHAVPVLQFAQALAWRSRRVRVFVFSTELRDITTEIRSSRLPQLGEAWGGGTRIGTTLRTFERRYTSLLTDDTVAIVVSDGLDFGDPELLGAAAAEFRRRCAAFVWVSPDAGAPGYAPATRGMRAALPSLSLLAGIRDLPRLSRLLRVR